LRSSDRAWQFIAAVEHSLQRQTRHMTEARVSEEQFYTRYSWCLNPVLSVEDLLRRFREEVGVYETVSGWQREESKANLYIFACAVACTADDYFALPWLNLKPLANRVPQLRPAISAFQTIADTVQSGVKVRDHAAWRWRRCWDECVAEVCRLVIADRGCEGESFSRVRRIAGALCAESLPPGLLRRRMRLPEAFRAQDMAHHDVITLIDRFCASDKAKSARDSGAVLMGLRTAGAYFAALMAECLKQQGFQNVSWFSIRPKNGIAQWEAQRLRDVVQDQRQLLVVDDYPATGHTFRVTMDILRTLGVKPEQMSILAPTHPAETQWAALAGIQAPVRVFTFPTDELFKVKSLAPSDVERLCREYYGDDCNARVTEDPSVGDLNNRLAEHSKDGHQVREKRVFAVELQRGAGSPATKRLFFKSVGWGWLGYHAYIAGKRLKGFVPAVIGLRNGMLLMEWIEQVREPAVAEGQDMVPHIARYIAARACRLALDGDCRLASRTYRWTGFDDIVNILRRAYGPYVNRLKVPALRNQLQRVVTSAPTFIDGRMRSEEWLQTPAGVFKADFEHHTFGGAEVDLVDPAYDLAGAIYEFHLSKQAEQQLLRTYVDESGDSAVQERLLLHKILYGTSAMKHAAGAIAAGRDHAKNNERLQYARTFLIYSMNEFCAQFVRTQPASKSWSPLLFFMDLDGVFDNQLLGFPHATGCGLQSIALLHAHGFSIVLNTGRSIQHVRQYCDAYGFSGGVAEYGSVFLDMVNGREVSLVDADASRQLAACREAMRAMPGVFIDDAYEYSIRAYRYSGGETAGLEVDEIENLLKRPEFSKLTYLFRSADTYIIQDGIDKGSALQTVRGLVGRSDVPVTAIGDSQDDIAMFAAAEFAYAPANCSPLVREVAGEVKCRIVKGQFQKGLLAAVQDRLKKQPASELRQLYLGRIIPSRGGVMEGLLHAADRGPVPQILSALMWWK
jgi:hydroxymethylpyrimidine pyrophosphatase-like HAD family hydrolase/orotate phosphoribosyltransferase